MLKAKFCSFAIACMIGLFGTNPISALAAEVSSGSSLLYENEKDQQIQSAFEEKMIAATEKWKTLSQREKNEVYTLIEKEMKAKFKVMGQLVKLGVINEEDAAHYKTRMVEKYNAVKESGELPLPKYRVKKQ